MRVTPHEQRLETLARLHGSRVLAYLARRVTPREDAADVYQQVLTTTWRKIHKVPEADDAALCWMLAVARRESSNHRRSAARRHAATDRLRDLFAEDATTAYGTGSSPDEATDRVTAALGELSDGDREVLTLVYWDELTSEQAGLVLGSSAAATRKRLERARSRIAVILGTTDPSASDRGRERAGRERASVITGG